MAEVPAINVLHWRENIRFTTQQKIVLLILGLVLIFFALSQNAHAANARIISLDNNAVYYGTNTKFVLVIDAAGMNGVANYWDNGIIIDQKTFVSTTTTLNFFKTWTQLGTRNIQVTLTNFDLNDDNLADNSVTKNITVLKGVDFIISDVNILQTILLPGSTINITIDVNNIGDTDFVGSLPITLSLDNNEVAGVNIFDINQHSFKRTQINYLLPANITGTHTFTVQANPNGTIKEFALSNNSVSRAFNTNSLPNLSVEWLAYDTNNTRKGGSSAFSFRAKNSGQIVNSVLVRVYKDQITNTTKIYENTIATLDSNESQLLNFSYFFTSEGITKFFVYVDPLNDISETNENDNVAEIDVNVAYTDFSIDYSSYLVNLTKLEGELRSCNDDFSKVQSDTIVCRESLSSMTNERNSCTSNLNIANTNNATFLSNWKEERDQNYNQTINQLKATFDGQLAEKDSVINANNETTKNKYLDYDKQLNFSNALVILLLIIMIGKVVVPFIKNNRRTQIIKN